MAAYDQLALYNDALTICEERELASLNEDRKPRRLLDGVWNRGGVKACLEEGFWGFATRSAEVNYDQGIQPDFGFIHAFKHPPDWVRTSAVAPDPYFQTAFLQYADEAGYWWSDLPIMYVKYVSNDAAYGGNMLAWSESFKQLAAAHFADKVIGSLSHDKDLRAKVQDIYAQRIKSARSKDTMNNPTQFPSQGQWTRARQGRSFGRFNRCGQGYQ